jgi:hypothetical protein
MMKRFISFATFILNYFVKMRSFNNAVSAAKSKNLNWLHEVIRITILYDDVHVSFTTGSGTLSPEQSKDTCMSAATRNSPQLQWDTICPQLQVVSLYQAVKAHRVVRR